MEPRVAISAPPQVSPEYMKHARHAIAQCKGDEAVRPELEYRLACLAAAHDYKAEHLVALVEMMADDLHDDNETAAVTSILAAEEFLNEYSGIGPVAIDSAYKLACLATGLGCSLHELVDGHSKGMVDRIISPRNIHPLPPARLEVLEHFVTLALMVNWAVLAHALFGACLVCAKFFFNAPLSWITTLAPLCGLPIQMLLAKFWDGSWRQFASLVSDTGHDTPAARKLECFRWFGALCIIFGPTLTISSLNDFMPWPWWMVFPVVCFGPLLFGSSTAKQIRKHIALGRPVKA